MPSDHRRELCNLTGVGEDNWEEDLLKAVIGWMGLSPQEVRLWTPAVGHLAPTHEGSQTNTRTKKHPHCPPPPTHPRTTRQARDAFVERVRAIRGQQQEQREQQQPPQQREQPMQPAAAAAAAAAAATAAAGGDAEGGGGAAEAPN